MHMKKTNQHNDKLTIILAIRDRPYYTRRSMSYANQLFLPFKILVADGGKDEQLQFHLCDTSNYPNIDYEYLRFPYDRTYVEFYHKMHSTLSKVSTPYSVLANDDDFYLTEGLLSAVDFLENNDDYHACAGQTTTFINRKNKWYFT